MKFFFKLPEYDFRDMPGFEQLPKKVMQLADWISGQESCGLVMSAVGTVVQPRII